MRSNEEQVIEYEAAFDGCCDAIEGRSKADDRRNQRLLYGRGLQPRYGLRFPLRGSCSAI